MSTNVDYATATWWIHVRAFLHYIQGNFQIEEKYTFWPLRDNDCSIMERITQTGNYGKTTLKRLNACRLYHRIIYISEILETNTKLDPKFLTKEGQSQSKSQLNWPNQNCPDTKTWKTWKQVLQDVFTTEDGHTLREPVGQKWLPQYSLTRKWEFTYHALHQIIVHQQTGETFKKTSDSRRNHIFEKTTYPIAVNKEGVPVVVSKGTNKLYVYNLQGKHSQVEEINKSEPLKPQVTMMATDGSVLYGEGTYGWLKGNTSETLDTGSGRVTGGRGTMNWFRAEAQGVASLLDNSTDVEINQASLYLDNLGVVNRLQQQRPIHPLKPDWEILEGSRRRLHRCQVGTYHVKGHQTPKPSAPREVHMNNQVDELATKAHTQANHYSPIPTGYGILLYINGEPITGRYGKEIHHTATTPEISNYYKQKHKWTDEDMDTIDWDAFGRAQNNFTQLQQRNIHKLVHNWLPTGEQLDQRYHTNTQCPNCNH